MAIEDYPPVPPFVLDPDRTHVTGGEPGPRFFADPRYPDVDFVPFRAQGGGKVPEDFSWDTNPKQRQDEVSAG